MSSLEYAERLRIESALTRVVDERGTDNDWRIVVDARKTLGNDVVMKMAQDVASKLRQSRIDSNAD